MTQSSTYALRLPKSLKEAVMKVAKRDGVSINQFIALAVAEKLATLETARFFEERQKRADLDAFAKLLNRAGGEPPRNGDEMPAKR